MKNNQKPISNTQNITIPKKNQYTYKIEWYNNGVLIKMSGNVSSNDILDVNKAIVEDPRLDTITFEIWDLSEVSKIADKDRMAKVLYNYDKHTSQWSQGLKMASVTSTADMTAVFEEYNRLMRESHWDPRTFASLEEALKWVKT